MSRITAVIGLMLAFILLLTVSSSADPYLETMKQNQTLNGFKVLNLYESSTGAAMGARLISEKHGFVIDLLRIQSVPQAFFWIKTPPTSSKGEPHACEHLLLGKGNRGRYVATLEDMALGNSSAWTEQLRTCYHFNTPAGEKTFYDIFEAKLQAFLHPDFTDEEIRREVCHIGVNRDSETGKLSLEEKGTVYTEMVSSFEKPWYYLSKNMDRLLYGSDHPIGYVSGGDPAVMRSMTAQDMWRFHKENYHLGNMGVVVAIPDAITMDGFLVEMSEILDRCQPGTDSNPLVGIGKYDLPAAKQAPPGTAKLAHYPSDKLEDPGNFAIEWPSDLDLGPNELFLLDIFISTFASGETSNLYDLFINSQTRKLDVGPGSVYGGMDTDQGIAVYFGLANIDNQLITATMVDSLRSMIIGEIRRVHDFADGSPELADFNEKVEGRLQERSKQLENYLNSPPMFGFRSGVGAGWLSLLRNLERVEGFRKSLIFKPQFNFVNSLLAHDRNIWADFIEEWRFLTVEPYLVATSPSSDILTREAREKEERFNGYIAEFKKKYGVADDQEAIARYKEEFDANTVELEALAEKQELPGFIDNPPMTHDDQLNYTVITLPGDVPMVASTFDNMTSSQVGIALRLDVIPDSLLTYVPLLPDILTEIGAVKDGQAVPFDEMQQRLRSEVLDLHANFSNGYQTERVELVLSGRGSKLDELKNALSWMNAALYAPLLSEDNIPRMMDVVDRNLSGLRNRMKAPEEYWVRYPVAGYRFQHNPLMMSTNCFLTQTHEMHRAKWQLTDPGNEQEQQELGSVIDALAEYGRTRDRDEIGTVLSAVEKLGETQDEVTPAVLQMNFHELSEHTRTIAAEIANSLRLSLGDIPDENLAGDWQYLCAEIKQDLMMQPQVALDHINQALNLIRKSDNARMFIISNDNDRSATMGMIENFVNKLDKTPSQRQQYANTDRVIQRLHDRVPEQERPVYVGLVHEGTRNGVLVFSSRVADVYDTDTESVLDCLSGKLYGGGGPHGLFMKTWAAGLAYSNGYSYNQSNGRVGYYAERCPDVAATMRFVVSELKNAQPDPSLKDYAIAQVFGYSRAPNRYEDRGVAMADDLADNVTPEIVRAYRQKVLDLRNDSDLYNRLVARMEKAYGPTLIGYGQSLAQSQDGTFFLIGPEPQFQSLEEYIEDTEGGQKIYRLYPRDFWLTM